MGTIICRDVTIKNLETGEAFKITNLNDIDTALGLGFDNDDKFVGAGMRSHINPSTAGEITFEAKIDPRALLYIFTGIKVTNNWLKMHGGVMSRRKR